MRSLTLVAIFIGMAINVFAASGPFHWGINGHPVSQEAYWDVPLSVQLDLVSELHVGWYRIDIGSKAFVANTLRCDEFVSGAEERKLRILPVLLSSPGPWSATATPEEIRKSATAFAQSIVSRYKGRITHWELSNELDAFAMVRKGETTRSGTLWKWDGAPDGSNPDDYDEARYQKAKAEIQGLYEGIKAVDPSAVTIVDTAGWLHYGFIERLVNEDHVPFDILAWHWYSEMGDMTNVQGKLDLVALLKRFGKPIWITEINRRDGSKGGKDNEQAVFISQAAAQLRTHPDISAFFIYELLDEPNFGANGESHYGLVEVAKDQHGKWQISRRKPAFDLFKAACLAK